MAGNHTETAPAKINLALHVLGQRADGFHTIESLVCFADCGDTLLLEPAETDRLTITGPFAQGLLNDGANLVLRALAAFRAAWPDAMPGAVNVHLTKNLPIASGIGGGSADAAATLRLLARSAKLSESAAELAKVALTLGADVPVCLHDATVIMRGIGDQISAAPQLPATHILLVNPRVPSATPEVFAALHNRENPPLPPLPDKFSSVDALIDWLSDTRNDLGPAAMQLVPEIADLTADLNAVDDCLFARLSGSGATVFGLFENAAAARSAGSRISAKYPHYWVMPTRIRADDQ